jgi:hypothetical protein
MIDDFGYTDSFDEDKKAVRKNTYPSEGYYIEGIYTPNSGDIVSHTIDYCLQANEGFICDKYLVDTEKVSGDGIEAPAHTSDHYPVYCELTPYNPLDEFESLNYDKEYAVTNNSFSDYDHLFNFLDTKSNKTNHDTYLAINAAHNGNVKDTSRSLTKYNCVGNLSINGGYIEYKINSNKNQRADLVMVMAASLSGIKVSGDNARVVGLNNFNTLSLNNRNVDISKVNLRNDDVSAWYEWEQVVIKNVDLLEGENTLRMETKAYSNGKYYCPNQLLLEVFY